MKNGTSSRPTPNLKELLDDMQFQELLDYVEDKQQDIFTEWLEKDEETFRTTLRYEYALLDETADYLHTDQPRYAVLRLGCLLGTIESFERVLFEHREDQWAQAKFQKETIQVKHLPEVIRALETHGAMFHAELGEYLGLNPPTLTEAMKKVLDTGAVQASHSGKYKIYTLTDAGLRYGRELRRKKRSGDPLGDAIQTIREHLENTNNEVEQEAAKTILRSMIEDGASVEIHPDDTVNLWYQPSREERVTVQSFLVQSILKENTPSREVSLIGAVKPHFSHKQKARALCNRNFTQAVANA